MTHRWRNYTAYSIGCAIVWLVLLALVSGFDPAHTRHIFWLVSGGWWIGWLSATIARVVYPATKAQQRATAA
jgi:hypothetical protein